MNLRCKQHFTDLYCSCLCLNFLSLVNIYIRSDVTYLRSLAHKFNTSDSSMNTVDTITYGSTSQDKSAISIQVEEITHYHNQSRLRVVIFVYVKTADLQGITVVSL